MIERTQVGSRLRAAAVRQVFRLRPLVNGAPCLSRSVTGRLVEVGEDRESWERALLQLIEPVARALADGALSRELPLVPLSVWGRRSDVAEATARTFIGAAFYLQAHRPDEPTVLPSGARLDLAAIYSRAIAELADPRSRAYWGAIRARQPLVENAFICLGLMLTPAHIWERYADADRERIVAWVRSCSEHHFNHSNWQWFKIFHLLFLRWAGEPIAQEAIDECLAVIDGLYLGGWYTDDNRSDERAIDYYNAWTMQFFGLLFCRFADESFAAEKRVLAARAAEFLRGYRLLFQPGGGHVVYGRTQIYRFATLAPFGPAIAAGVECDIADAKAICIDSVNAACEVAMLDRSGFLSAGVFGRFAAMTEYYSGAGSPYWALLGFSALLLSADHEFWRCRARRRTTGEAATLEHIGVVLAPQANGEMLMLNAGISSNSYSYKYNKLAFSSGSVLDYDERFPADNQLLFRSGRRGWEAGRTIESTVAGHGRLAMVWRPRLRTGNVVVETHLESDGSGYVARHHVSADRQVGVAAGGFALAHVAAAGRGAGGGSAYVEHAGHISAIELLTGRATAGLVRRTGVNPRWAVVEVPVLFGRVEAGSTELTYRVTRL